LALGGVFAVVPFIAWQFLLWKQSWPVAMLVAVLAGIVLSLACEAYLCRIEPEALLRSDISKVQSHRKHDLIAAILEKAKRADLFDERNFGRFFSSLKHPELANQLRRYPQVLLPKHRTTPTNGDDS